MLVSCGIRAPNRMNEKVGNMIIRHKPDIWVILVIVIGLGVFATTNAESASLDDQRTIERLSS